MDKTLQGLRARPGAPIAPRWPRLLEWLDRHARITAGPGCLVTSRPDGTVISARPRRVLFRGAFSCSLGGSSLTCGAGTVNDQPTTLGGVPLGGDPASDTPAPELRLRDVADDLGRWWICLQVRTDADGAILRDLEDAITITQADHPTRSGDPLIGRAPVAFWDGTRLHQILYFHQIHRASEDNNGILRHFFGAAA